MRPLLDSATALPHYYSCYQLHHFGCCCCCLYYSENRKFKNGHQIEYIESISQNKCCTCLNYYIKNYTPKKLCAFSAWTEELKLHKLHKVIQINKKLYLHILWWFIRSNKYRWFKLKSTFWRVSNSRKCGLKMWLVCLPVSRSVQGKNWLTKTKTQINCSCIYFPCWFSAK